MGVQEGLCVCLCVCSLKYCGLTSVFGQLAIKKEFLVEECEVVKVTLVADGYMYQ